MGCGASSPPAEAVPADTASVQSSTLKPMIEPTEAMKKKLAAESRVLKSFAMRQSGRSMDALAELNAVIESDPEIARAYLERAAVLVDLERYDEAMADLDKNMEMQGRSSVALAKRAEALMKMGRFDEASDDCWEAQELDGTDNAELKKLKAQILQAKMERDGTSIIEDEEPGPVGAGMEDYMPGNKPCMVCMDADRGCRLQPCRHFVLCFSCATDIKQRGFGCPICNAPIEDIEIGDFKTTFVPMDVERARLKALEPPAWDAVKKVASQSRLLHNGEES